MFEFTGATGVVYLTGLIVAGAVLAVTAWLAQQKKRAIMRWTAGGAGTFVAVYALMSLLLPSPDADASLTGTGVVWYDPAFRADIALTLLVIALLTVIAVALGRVKQHADAHPSTLTGRVLTGVVVAVALLPLAVWLWGVVRTLAFPGFWLMPFAGMLAIGAVGFAVMWFMEGAVRGWLLVGVSTAIALVQYRFNVYFNANAESIFEASGAVPYIIPVLPLVVGAALAVSTMRLRERREYAAFTLSVGTLVWMLVLVGFVVRFMGHYDYEGTYAFNLSLLLERPLQLLLTLTGAFYALVPREVEPAREGILLWNAVWVTGGGVVALLLVLNNLRLRSALDDKTNRASAGLTLKQRRYVLALILIAPALLLRLFTTLYPFVQTALLSVQRFNPAFPPKSYVGWSNFERLANDLVVRESLTFTLVFVFVSTAFQIVLGLAVAHLLNAKFRLRDTGRTISLIPWAIPMVVAAIGFRWMFDEDFGLIPDMILRLTGQETSWLINPVNAKIAVIIVNIWKSTPFVALILLAGLQGIGEDLYEAARVDGATRWHSLYYITIPMIMPILVSTTMYMLVWQLAVFDLTFAMTGGGPGFSTTVLAQKIYTEINSLNYSFAAALSMMLVIVVTVIGVIGLYTFRRVEVES